MDDQEKSELRKLARIDEPLQENVAANPSGFLRDMREIAAEWKVSKREVEAVVKGLAKEDPRKAAAAAEFLNDVDDAIQGGGSEAESLPSVRRGTQGM